MFFLSRHKTMLLLIVLLAFWIQACFINSIELDGFPCSENNQCVLNETCFQGKCYKSPPLVSDATETIVPETKEIIPEIFKECEKNSSCLCSQKCDEKSFRCVEVQCKENKDCQCDWFCNSTTQKCQKEEPPKPECDAQNPCKDCDTSCDLQLKICRIVICNQDTDCRCNWFCNNETKRCQATKPVVQKSCVNPEDCESLRCVEGFCLGACENNQGCFNGRICKQGKCEKPNKEEPCNPTVGCNGKFLCLEINSQTLCKQPCDLFVPNDCTSPEVCLYQESSLNGKPFAICMPKKTGKLLNEICANTSECETSLFCSDDGKEKKCRHLCDPNQQNKDCPTGQYCVTKFSGQKDVGLCMPATCDTIASICKTSEDCFEGQCYAKCTLSSDCQTNQFCREEVSSSKQFCFEKECNVSGKYCALGSICNNSLCENVPDMKECTLDADCKTGLQCAHYKLASDEFKRCLQPCTPKASNTCPNNYFCTAFPGSPVLHYCLPKKSGGRKSYTCDLTTKPCEWSYICLRDNGFPNDSAKCAYSCDPSVADNNPECNSTETCKKISSYNIGYCKTKTKVKEGSYCGAFYGDCESPLICASFSDYSKCVKDCGNDPNSCSLSKMCIYDPNRLNSSCRELCSSDSDCQKNESCFTLTGSSNKICWPN